MKKQVSVLLLSIFFFQVSFSHYNYLESLHVIWTDFQYHKEKYGDDLFSYYAKHYGTLKDKHAAQHKKDRQEQKNKHKHPLIQSHADLFTFQRFVIIIAGVKNYRHNYFYLPKSYGIYIKQSYEPPERV